MGIWRLVQNLRSTPLTALMHFLLFNPFPFVNPADSTHPGVSFVFCVYHRVGLDCLPLVYEVGPWNGVIRINMCLFNFNPFHYLDFCRIVNL